MSQAATSTGPLHNLKSKLSGKQIILVQGACGTLGFQIVKSLQEKIKSQPNLCVVAGVSDMNDPTTKELGDLGVDVIHLDLRNHDMVENAFTLNVQKLVIIPPFLNNRVPLVSRIVDIARDKGVKHIVLLSLVGTQTEELDIFRAFKTIQNKSVPLETTLPLPS
jgi:nucleoside-diphosphate-sugar epimerase